MIRLEIMKDTTKRSKQRIYCTDSEIAVRHNYRHPQSLLQKKIGMVG